MARRVEQPVRRLLFHHLPGIHHLHPSSGFGDHAHIMGNQHKPHAVLALQVHQQIQNLFLDRHVQRCRRLIGNQQARLAGNRHRNHHPLVHPAGHLVRKIPRPARRIGNAHLFQQLDHPVLHPLLRHRMMRPQRLGDLPAHRIARVERGHRLLKNHRHVFAHQLAPLAWRNTEQIRAIKAQHIGRHLARPADQPHRREHGHRLARSAFADHAQYLTSLDRHVHAIHRAETPTGGGELDRQIANFEQGHQRFNFGSSASRSPSPNRLNASTVIRMANPGKASTHQAR